MSYRSVPDSVRRRFALLGAGTRGRLYLVNLRTLIGRTFALVAITGLILSPLARPVMAMPMDMQAASSEDRAAMADQGSMAMPDMPCCPDKVPDCKKDCPLMALCMVHALQAALQSPMLPVPYTLLDIIAPGDEANLSGLAQPPPLGPPRT